MINRLSWICINVIVKDHLIEETLKKKYYNNIQIGNKTMINNLIIIIHLKYQTTITTYYWMNNKVLKLYKKVTRVVW